MVMFLAMFVGLYGAANAAHYEKPPCSSDEVKAQLQGGGQLCAPACSGTSCPSDVPAGVTASPKCILKDSSSGKSYCGLLCKADSDCGGGGASCSLVAPQMGICTFPVSDVSEVNVAAVSPKDDAETLFEEFEKTFGKVYASFAERALRLSVFTENLISIEQSQMADPSATYSHLTPFADWTIEEYSARNNLRAHAFDKSSMGEVKELDVSDLPTEFDWRTKGAVNPVKNQAQCGSCWAFSTVANIEGVNFLKTKQLVSLSEQELVDCDKKTGDMGCQGGLPSNAFKDMIENKIGLELETDYPYTAANGKCTAVSSKEKIFISNWTTISSDEDQMAAALIKYGPLSIGINASPMQFYHGGVSSPWKIFCNPKSIDHGVAIVGFGEDNGKKYWTIRNSWGETWGEKGYYRIIRGTNACGLTSMVTTSFIGDSASAAPAGDLVI